jgi:hypothetical protein
VVCHLLARKEGGCGERRERGGENEENCGKKCNFSGGNQMYHGPILFSKMQLVTQKFCLDQLNDCYILLPTAHANHQEQAYLFPLLAHALGKVAGTGRGPGLLQQQSPKPLSYNTNIKCT